MPEIFISYARATAAKAQQIAEALRDVGHGVWWDDALPAHRDYSEVIEERLREAKAVVVVWSSEAVASQWVRAEANRARQQHKLVQLRVDDTPLPLPFDQIQCADLSGWSGDLKAQGWTKVAGSVQDLVQATKPPSTSAPEHVAGLTSAGARASAAHRASICVLPFANMSDDPQQEYFSDGISEDIITDLSKVSALSVISRNSAFRYKGEQVDIPQVARDLDVSHVLEGSVRKAGGRVRITAQLIDGAANDHVWAERYDRDLTDIFALQDEISQAIVKALRLKLLPEEKVAIERRGTAVVGAYNLYLMARSYLQTGNLGDVRETEAIERLCSRAVEIDPGYAEAWALLGSSQRILHRQFGREGDAGQAAVDRALMPIPRSSRPAFRDYGAHHSDVMAPSIPR